MRKNRRVFIAAVKKNINNVCAFQWRIAAFRRHCVRHWQAAEEREFEGRQADNRAVRSIRGKCQVHTVSRKSAFHRYR